MGERLLTLPEAGERLGCSLSTVYRLVRSGELRVVRAKIRNASAPEGVLRVPESAIAESVEEVRV